MFSADDFLQENDTMYESFERGFSLASEFFDFLMGSVSALYIF
jgi:hypothetical protein